MKRKEKLQEIRNMKGKPIHKDDLKEHERHYESIVRRRMAELEEERMRKYSNLDYDPSKYKTKTNEKVFLEDEVKKKEQLQRLNEKRMLSEKKMSYGEFVNKVHRPVISIKKKQEMDHLIEKSKHPIKESKKVPSSASYHDLYNTNGENPWNSKTHLLGQSRISSLSATKLTTPINRFKNHSRIGSREMSNNKIRHKSTGKISLQDEVENSHNIDHNISEVPKTHHSTMDDSKGAEKPPRKLIISK